MDEKTRERMKAEIIERTKGMTPAQMVAMLQKHSPTEVRWEGKQEPPQPKRKLTLEECDAIVQKMTPEEWDKKRLLIEKDTSKMFAFIKKLQASAGSQAAKSGDAMAAVHVINKPV